MLMINIKEQVLSGEKRNAKCIAINIARVRLKIVT